MPNKVGIVIVCYNQLAYTKICLSSILKNTRIPYKIFIVNNGSQDGTKEFCDEMLRQYPYKFVVIHSSENLGFAKGNNLALREIQKDSSYTHIFLLNNDTIVPPRYAENLIKTFSIDKTIGACGPVTNYAGNRQGIKNVNIIPATFEEFATKFEFSPLNHHKSYPIGMLVGFALMMKRECFDKVGLLDERFQNAWEDNDYCLRIANAGYKMYVAQDCFIYHFGSRTIKSMKEINYGKEMFEKNKKRFYDKWADINKVGEYKKIVGMLRVKNGGEILRETLSAHSRLCDEIVVFDDYSTDNTEEICKSFPKVVDYFKSEYSDFNEARDRNYVLQMAKKRNPDWIFCLAKDTKIPLIDGTMKSIEELSNVKDFSNTHVYSVDSENKRIIAGNINKVWKTGTREVLKITLDNNESFKCTEDHLIMLRDGNYVKAKELKENDSLMPLYRKWNHKGLDGYELLYNPLQDTWNYSHRIFYKFFSNIGRILSKYVIHHINYNKKDNSKENLVRMLRNDHLSLHGKNHTKEHNEKIKKFRNSVEGKKQSSESSLKNWNNLSMVERLNQTSRGRKACLSKESRDKKSKSIKKIWDGMTNEEKSKRCAKAWVNKSKEERYIINKKGWDSLSEEQRNLRGKAISDGKNKRLNHSIIKIEKCGIEDVYDMEIDKYHNFAIGFNDESGIFVHNCIDHDEVPSEELIRDIQKIVNNPNPEKKLYCFQICHLWNTNNQQYPDAQNGKYFRSDGLWSFFEQGRLFKNEPNQEIKGNEEGLHCLSGDTVIPLINGKSFTIKELSNLKSFNNIWSYSINENNDIVPGKIIKAWKTGVKQVIKITLDNGESFKCTSDHLIMMRDGSYKLSGELKDNDSLMPLYKNYENEYVKGYELFYNPGENKWHFSHRFFWKYFNNNQIQKKGYVIHHKDYNKLNNNPENLELMSNTDHAKFHSKQRTPEHIQKILEFNKSEEKRRITSIKTKERMNKLTKEEIIQYIKPLALAQSTPEARKNNSKSQKKYWELLSEEEKNKKIIINKNRWTTELRKNASEKTKLQFKNMSPEIKKEIAHKKSISHKNRFNNNDNLRFQQGKAIVLGRLKLGLPIKTETLKKYNIQLNHKVIKIEQCGIEDVYDMSIEKYHNFAIGFNDKSGIFVHNCGSHAFFPIENVEVTPYRIKHYGNIDPQQRLKKYMWYTATDKNKDRNAILGGYYDFYKDLYARIESDKPENQGKQLGQYEFKDSDYYRHIVNENSLVLTEWKENVKLSAAIIIQKSDYEYLPKCLESIKNVVDEIIIVCTDEEDRETVVYPPEFFLNKKLDDEIVNKLFVYAHKWRDSFSEARNFAMSKCTGNWILRIDADEQLHEHAILPLKRIINNDEAEVILFPIANYMNPQKEGEQSKWTLSKTARVYKNIEGLKYVGRVHEEINDSIEELGKTRQMRIYDNFPVHLLHYGYLKPKNELYKKYDYYNRLLHMDTEENPKKSEPFFNLAVDYFHKDDLDKSEMYYRKTLELKPNQWMASHDLGVVLFKKSLIKIKNDLEESLQYYSKSKELLLKSLDQSGLKQVEANMTLINNLLNYIKPKERSIKK